MWTTTSRSSQTLTSCAPLWRSQSCGSTRDRARTGWTEMDLQSLIAKRRYSARTAVYRMNMLRPRLLLLIAPYFTGRLARFRQKDGRYQQLQLQGGERSRSLFIPEINVFVGFLLSSFGIKIRCCVLSDPAASQ